MNAIKQVSKNPFQPVHTFVPRSARTAPHHDLPECHLVTEMRLTGPTHAATRTILFFGQPCLCGGITDLVSQQVMENEGYAGSRIEQKDRAAVQILQRLKCLCVDR